jgi:hypothetical protein
MKMVSPAPKASVSYHLDVGGATGWFSIGGNRENFSKITREDLLLQTAKFIQAHKCTMDIEILPDPVAHHVPRGVLEHLWQCQDAYQAEHWARTHLLIGKSLSMLQKQLLLTASRYLPVRTLPGSTATECPVCGGPGDLQDLLFFCRCGYQGDIQLWMPWAAAHDLHRALDREFSKYFINSSWNPHPPWMTHDELQAVLGTEKESEHGDS